MAHDDTPLEDLLRRRRWEGAADADPDSIGTGRIRAGGELCGDPELLAAYAEGRLPSPARELLERHLAACAACQTAVVRLVRLAPQESVVGSAAARPEAAAPAHGPAFRWRWALPALAGVALVGSFVYYERGRIVAPDQPVAPAVAAKRSAPLPEVQTPSEAPTPPGPTARPGAVSPATKDARVARAAPAEKDRDWRQQQPQALGGAAAQKGAPAAASTAAPAAAPAPPVSATRPADVEQPPAEENKAALQSKAPAEGKPALERKVEAGAESSFKKQAEITRDELRAKEKPAVQPKPSVGDKLGQTPAPEPPAAPESAAQSAMAQSGRYNQRSQAAEEKSAARADSAGPRRERSAPGAAGLGVSNEISTAAQKAEAFGPIRKSLSAGSRRLALTTSGRLLAARAPSGEWQPLSVPSGAAVIDFTISGEHLWVLFPHGRLGHSPNLGRTWDPPIETGVDNATAILFTNPRSGEILTRSGRRLRTTDGGETWRKQE